MSFRLVLTPRAQGDLDEIWDFTEEKWGVEQAQHYTNEIWYRMSGLTAGTLAGRTAADLRRGYLRLACGSHVVFYRQGGAQIEIIRILHERMDPRRNL